MKQLTMAFALCVALCIGISSMAQEAKPTTEAAKPAAKASTEYQGLDNPGACMARGLANVATGWVEIPRCAIYDNSAVPFFGLLIGIPEGAFFTVARTLTGTLDIVSFGFTRDGMHGKSFPDFVWQARWIAPSESK